MYEALPYLALAIGFASTAVGVVARSDGGISIYGKLALALGFASMAIGAALLYFRPPGPPIPIINERFDSTGWRGSVPSGAEIALTATCPYVFSVEPFRSSGGVIPNSERHLNVLFADFNQRHEFTVFDPAVGQYVPGKWPADQIEYFDRETNMSFAARVEAELRSREAKFRKIFVTDWVDNGRGIGLGPVQAITVPDDGPSSFIEVSFLKHVFARDNKCSGQIEVTSTPR